jgi:hypothetical protein
MRFVQVATYAYSQRIASHISQCALPPGKAKVQRSAINLKRKSLHRDDPGQLNNGQGSYHRTTRNNTNLQVVGEKRAEESHLVPLIIYSMISLVTGGKVPRLLLER